MYITNKKDQIFNNAIYDKIICYCQINAKLKPKLGATAKVKKIKLMPNLQKKCQTAKLKFLQPRSFRIPI